MQLCSGGKTGLPYLFLSGSSSEDWKPLGEPDDAWAGANRPDETVHRGEGAAGDEAAMSIAIVEARVLFREALATVLRAQVMVPVHAYPGLAELLKDFDLVQPTVILLGCPDQMFERSLADMRTLCRECEHASLIAVVDDCGNGKARMALNCGVAGVFPMSMSTDILRVAVELIGAGGKYIPIECLLEAQATEEGEVAQPPPGMKAGGLLTPREEEVLEQLCSGMQNKQIAHKLGLSEGTVKVHLHHLMRKLGTGNRAQTVLVASRLFGPYKASGK